jgi:putative transposase
VAYAIVSMQPGRQLAGNNFLQQQAKFDDFIECYNNERPHQALNMRYPAERYRPSTRLYRGLPDLDYPFHDKTVTVTTCGRICFNRQKINLSVVFTGQSVGIKQVSEPLESPFGPKVLPMSQE